MHPARFAAIATLIVASPAYAASSFTSLYSFTGGSDGSTPMAGFVADSNGNLYGTAAYGGANSDGTVFEFTAAHQLVTLWTFTGGTDGSYPLGGLVLHGKLLYGTSSAGDGASGSGTIFSLNSATKQLTTLYSLSGPDGAESHSTLFREKSGSLVGTTFSGGANGYGEVFRLNPKNQTAHTGLCIQERHGWRQPRSGNHRGSIRGHYRDNV
jgi:uncharacterized repeat protein (TIGR03803 family)